MFLPKYSLSPKLLNTITKIERLYGQVDALKIPSSLRLNLKRDNLIQSSYASNKIEGNPLTLPEVTNLLLDDRVPTNRDEKEVVNYFAILEKLEEYIDKDFDLALVKELHNDLLTGVHDFAGEIRNEKVVIGKYQEEKGSFSIKVKHEPPHHSRKKIEKALKQLLEWVDSEKDTPAVLLAGIFHHEFVYLHPFEDGNGRVCRLLTALVFLKHGYQINKYFVLDDYYDIDRIQYSDGLSSADKGEKTLWLEYFTEGVKYSLQSALAKLKSSMQRMRIQDRPTPREKEVLEIMQEQPELRSSDVAKKLKVSRQQAHNLLSSLVEKDLIKRMGSTKSSYYVLK